MQVHSPTRPEIPPAWAKHEAEEEARKAELARARAEAAPVRLVFVDVSFGTIFRLVFSVMAAYALLSLIGLVIGTIGYLILVAFDVI